MPTKTVITQSLERQLENLSPSKHLPSLQIPPQAVVLTHYQTGGVRTAGQCPSGSPHTQPNPPFDLLSTVELQARHNRRTGYCLLSGQKTILIAWHQQSWEPRIITSLVSSTSVGLVYSAPCRPQLSPSPSFLGTNILANPHHPSNGWRLQRSVTTSCLRHGPDRNHPAEKKTMKCLETSLTTTDSNRKYVLLKARYRRKSPGLGGQKSGCH